MSAQIDVLAVLDEFALYVRNVSSRHALQGDILETRAAFAELIEQMCDVLELWDSNSMSIDGKAATMQCRPEKWRAALARVRAAK